MSYSKVAYVTTTGVGTFGIPSDFNPADNRVTCIGSGGSGSARVSSTRGGCGGGGGACAFSLNVNLTAGVTVDVSVGAGGGTVRTLIKDGIGGTTQVQADFGVTGTITPTAGAGGLVANCIGGSRFAGGSGFAVPTSTSFGGGAGGAAGLSGAGTTATTQAGGAADNSTVTGGAANTIGNNGTEFDSTHGSGSGAGGANAAGSGKSGGQYGGGGSGASSTNATTAGAGFQGLIALEYNPVPVIYPIPGAVYAAPLDLSLSVPY